MPCIFCDFIVFLDTVAEGSIQNKPAVKSCSLGLDLNAVYKKCK